MYPTNLLLGKQATLCFILLSACFAIFHSCKKNDLPVAQPHETGFVQKFFTPKQPPNKTVAAVIEKLKAENERTRFVNKLPANCGLPVWDKLVLQKKQQNAGNSFTSGDDKSDTTIILPLTNNDASLSAIITAIPDDDGYLLNCYTNNWLYNICHATNIDTAYANKLLVFFFYVENLTFGTTTFYHIPAALINGPSLPGSDSTKTVTIANVDPPTDGLLISTVCIDVTCPQSIVPGCVPQTTCIPVPGDGSPVGGGDGPGSGGNTGAGGGGQSGGGSGGTGTGGGTTCPLTTNVTWYGLMPPPDPCGPATPSTIPNPCDTMIAQLQNNANFVYNFHSLTGNGYGQPLNSSTDHEVGFLGQWANNLYIPKIGTSGSGEIDWSTYLSSSTKIDFILHSHNKGLNSIFSAQDIVLMAQVFLTGHAKDTASLCFGMTSVDNNSNSVNPPMLMKVTDAAAFKLFAQKIAGVNGNDLNVIGKFLSKYATSFNSPDPDANELEFLQMLKENGGLTAMGVYRGIVACNSWKKLALNSGSVTTINCY